jgi:hypothetical protein
MNIRNELRTVAVKGGIGEAHSLVLGVVNLCIQPVLLMTSFEAKHYNSETAHNYLSGQLLLMASIRVSGDKAGTLAFVGGTCRIRDFKAERNREDLLSCPGVVNATFKATMAAV